MLGVQTTHFRFGFSIGAFNIGGAAFAVTSCIELNSGGGNIKLNSGGGCIKLNSAS